MHPLSPWAVSIVLCFAAFSSLVSAHKVLQLDISKPKLNLQQRRKLQRDTVTEPLANMISLYTANVSVGTPPQQLQLQIDTGSSDIWMLSSTASICQGSADYCAGSIFDTSQSSTFTDVERGGFQITFQDQTSAQGDFFADVLRIGPDGSQISVNRQQMGLAIDTDIPNGIIGVGFALDESQCSVSGSSCQTYPTLTQNLVSQKVINTQAYSLWLNSLNANTGNILFGGIDTKKFTGKLVTLPIAPDAETGAYTSFTVAWTGFSLSTPDSQQGGFVPDNFAAPAILDSGTTQTLVPDDLAQEIFTQLNAQYNSQVESYIAPCSQGNTANTFDFEFGGSQGAVIRVPFSELLLNVLVDDEGNSATLDDGEAACVVGIDAAGDRPILFGDTFLRSAYVVYDIDKRQISLAQADFSSTGSNILEITSGQGLPSDSFTAPLGSVVQTATGLPRSAIPSTINRGGSTTPVLNSNSLPLAPLTATGKNNSYPVGTPSASSASSAQFASFAPSNSLASSAPLASYVPIASSAMFTPFATPTSSTPLAPVTSFSPAAFTGAAVRLPIISHSFPKLDGSPWVAAIVTIFIFLGGGLLLL